MRFIQHFVAARAQFCGLYGQEARQKLLLDVPGLSIPLLSESGAVWGEPGRPALEHIVGFVSPLPCLRGLDAEKTPEDVAQNLFWQEFLAPPGVGVSHPLGDVLVSARRRGLLLDPSRIPSSLALGADAPLALLHLTENVSMALTDERLPDGSSHVTLTAWPGGKVFYRARPEAMAELRGLVQRVGIPRDEAPPPPPPPPPAPPPRPTRVEAALADAGLIGQPGEEPFAPSGNLLRDLRRLGFSSAGTPDMGHVMRFEAEWGLVEACRGDAPTLARSTRYAIRAVVAGETVATAEGLDAAEAARTCMEWRDGPPAPAPSP